MIATLQGSGKTGLFISVRPRLEYHVVRSDGDGVVTSIEQLAEADVRINGGFFVFRRDILDVIEPGEELVERAVRPPDRTRRASRVSVRRLLGADGHDQGQAAARCALRERQRALASETPCPRELMLGFSLDALARPIERILAIGCHADDIEIGCGGNAPRVDPRDARVVDVTWVVLAAAGEAGRRGARERARPSQRVRGAADVRVHEFRDGFLPYVGGEVKEIFEGLKDASARPRLHAHARTTCTRITVSPAS